VFVLDHRFKLKLYSVDCHDFYMCILTRAFQLLAFKSMIKTVYVKIKTCFTLVFVWRVKFSNLEHSYIVSNLYPVCL